MSKNYDSPELVNHTDSILQQAAMMLSIAVLLHPERHSFTVNHFHRWKFSKYFIFTGTTIRQGNITRGCNGCFFISNYCVKNANCTKDVLYINTLADYYLYACNSVMF